MVGHELLTFMDIFLGYNQIHIILKDEEKIFFVTDHDLFCFRVMPLGLKNTWVTYQRLVHKVFKEQISYNMEAYLDDMLVNIHIMENISMIWRRPLPPYANT